MMDSIHLNKHYQLEERLATNSSYSVWSNFFLSARIPNAVANEYAIKFSQHRIRLDMLREITKEILLDMGINAMGDIIAILRHAKNLYTQNDLKVELKPPITSSSANNNNNNMATLSRHQNLAINNHNNNSNNNNMISQRPPIITKTTTQTIAPAANRVLSKPISSSSSRLSTNIVGSKIQSRVSLNSGALLATYNNPSGQGIAINTIHHQHNNERRAQNSSNISNSLAKRLRPATTTTTSNIDSIGSSDRRRDLPEKTLTVHYPSRVAIAKAKQRILSNNTSSSAPSSMRNGSNSVKSRLGTRSEGIHKSEHRNKHYRRS